MDVNVEHEVSGMTVRAEVCGIERGTSLQRVTDALRAVKKGMSEPKAAEPERSDWHLDSDIQTIREQAATIKAKDVAITGLIADRKKLNVEIAHLTKTLQDYEGMIDRGEETRKSLQDKVDDLKSLLKVEQEKLAASVKKHKATSRRLSTANKKLRNLDQ
jgi:chromosome segregation ATPase